MIMNPQSMRSRLLPALAALIFFVSGAGVAPASDDIPVQTITIFTTTPAYEFEVGTTLQFLAYPEPTDATDRTVVWFSSDPDVATIDRNTGLAEARSEGPVTISAHTTDGSGVFRSVGLVVKPTGTEYITVEPDSVRMKIGQNVRLRAIVKTDSVSDSPVRWTSSNPEVAAVDAEGIVEAVTCGDAVVTARYFRKNGSGIFAVTRVKVTDAAEASLNQIGQQGVRVDGRTLIMEGMTDDMEFEILASDGRRVLSGRGGRQAVALPGPGLYILRAGLSAFKIAVR